jgi:hypothetical protein
MRDDTEEDIHPLLRMIDYECAEREVQETVNKTSQIRFWTRLAEQVPSEAIKLMLLLETITRSTKELLRNRRIVCFFFYVSGYRCLLYFWLDG